MKTADEWKQIFAEAWRLQRDFYWAENMAGIDWPAMRAKYAKLLPRIATRGELNDILSQLIGELGTWHTYVFGGDSSFNPPKPAAVGVLGADIELDKDRAAPLCQGSSARAVGNRYQRPADDPHATFTTGDYLLAINNLPLGPTTTSMNS